MSHKPPPKKPPKQYPEDYDTNMFGWAIHGGLKRYLNEILALLIKIEKETDDDRAEDLGREVERLIKHFVIPQMNKFIGDRNLKAMEELEDWFNRNMSKIINIFSSSASFVRNLSRKRNVMVRNIRELRRIVNDDIFGDLDQMDSDDEDVDEEDYDARIGKSKGRGLRKIKRCKKCGGFIV